MICIQTYVMSSKQDTLTRNNTTIDTTNIITIEKKNNNGIYSPQKMMFEVSSWTTDCALRLVLAHVFCSSGCKPK